MAWRPPILVLATLSAALVLAGLAAAGPADDGAQPTCPDAPSEAGCPEGPPTAREAGGAPSSAQPDPDELVEETLIWADDTAAWAQGYPNATFRAALYMLQTSDERDQGDYPLFHANQTQRGADLALRPADEEARYPEEVPAYGGENAVNGSRGRSHRQVFLWEPAYAFLDGQVAPVPVTTLTETALVDDCDPHPSIEIVGEKGPRGIVVGQDPTTGDPVYRPGSGVVDGTGTAEDPYVIEGWCINQGTDPSSPGASIRIAETEAHVLVRGNALADHVRGVKVEDAANVTVAGNEIENPIGGLAIASQRTAFRDNLIEPTTIGLAMSGSNNTAEGNVVGHTILTGIGIRGKGHLVVGNVVNGAEDEGIEVGGTVIGSSQDSVVRGNVVEDARRGILLGEATGTLVEGNVVNGSEDAGVYLERTSGVSLVDNRITDSGADDAAVTLFGADDGLFRNNTVVDNRGPGFEDERKGHRNRFVGNTVEGNKGAGIRLGYRSKANVVEDNRLAGNWQGIDGPGSDHVVQGNHLDDTGGIELRGAGHVAVNNTVVGAYDGVRLGPGKGMEARANEVRDNDNGIMLRNLRDSLAADNVAVANEDNLFLRDAHDNEVRGNHLEGSDLWGVTLWSGSSGNVIEDNTVVDSGWDGVDVRQGSHNNTFRGNVIRDNAQDGLQIHDGADNTVADNVVTGHVGSYSWGLEVDGADRTNVTGNNVTGNRAGVDVEASANVTVQGNNLSATPDAGLRARYLDAPLDAVDNWWGDDTGPSGGVVDGCTGTTADGNGTRIRTQGADVCFDPWSTSPP